MVLASIDDEMALTMVMDGWMDLGNLKRRRWMTKPPKTVIGIWTSTTVSGGH